MNPYKELNIPEDATPEEIKQAYRDSAKEHHPDTGGDSERMSKLSEAYAILKNPERRRQYDENGSTELPQDKVTQYAMQYWFQLVDANPDNYKEELAELTSETHRAATFKISNINNKLSQYKNFLDRIVQKPSSDIFGDALRRHISDGEHSLATIRLELSERMQALALLAQYDLEEIINEDTHIDGWENIGSRYDNI